jgi:hypothetical protein
MKIIYEICYNFISLAWANNFVMVNTSKVVSNLQKPPMFMQQFKTTILTNKYLQNK